MRGQERATQHAGTTVTWQKERATLLLASTMITVSILVTIGGFETRRTREKVWVLDFKYKRPQRLRNACAPSRAAD